MKYLARGLFGIALAILSWAAAAQSSQCSSPLFCYDACLNNPAGVNCVSFCGGQPPSYFVSNHPECFGAGTTTSQVQINGTSFAQITAVSSALASRLLNASPNPVASVENKGMAAGGTAQRWNVWGNFTASDTHVSYRNAGNATTQNHSAIDNTIIGADYALSPTMVVGLSGALDRGNGSSLNNSPGNTPDAVASHGYLISPYFGMQLSKDLALDASVGMGDGKLVTGGATSSTARRFFAGANLSYSQWMGNIQLTGKAGLLHGEEAYGNSNTNGAINNSTAARNKLDQVRAGIQAGYWMNGFMPYASLTYASDLARTTTLAGNVDPVGKSALVWALGVNFFSLSSGVTGGIAYSQEELRTSSTNNSLIANISFRF